MGHIPSHFDPQISSNTNIMASRMASRSLFKRFNIGERYASQVATVSATSSATKSQSTQLPSGVGVHSLDNGSAISSVAILVKAGSRHETSDNFGVNHAIRLAAGLTSGKATSFSACRSIQQAGAKVDVGVSREYTLYLSQSPRTAVGEVMEFVTGFIDSPAFKPWDIGDHVSPRLAHSVGNIDNFTLTNELLHQAAFRDGLGNSLHSPDYMVGKHGPAMLRDFHERNYTADRMVVLGLNVDHEQAVSCGEMLTMGKGAGVAAAPSQFHAGQELRHPSADQDAVLALATSASSAANVKDAVATRLLQYVLGLGPKIKRGSDHGQLNKALSKINGLSSVSSLNYSYSDAGLLGAMIACESRVAGQVLESVAAALRSISVTEDELAAAKKAIRIDLEDASPVTTVETMAVNLSLGAKEVISPAQMVTMFENVSLADIQAVAKKLQAAKFSMGACGGLGDLPYIDQL